MAFRNPVTSLPFDQITGQISGAQIPDGTITGTKIANGSITTPKLVAGAVTANELGANSVIAGKVAAGAISATQLTAGAVTTVKLAAGAVTANELAANSVTAGKIVAGAIDGTTITGAVLRTGATGTRFEMRNAPVGLVGELRAYHTAVPGYGGLTVQDDAFLNPALEISSPAYAVGRTSSLWLSADIVSGAARFSVFADKIDIPGVGAEYENTFALTIPAATTTATRWDTAPRESHFDHDLTRPSGVAVAVTDAGLYALSATVDVTGGQANRAFIDLYGGAKRARSPFGVGDSVASAAMTVYLNAGDVIKVEVFCTTATAQRATAGNLNNLAIYRLAA